jgi:hypothetical protein
VEPFAFTKSGRRPPFPKRLLILVRLALNPFLSNTYSSSTGPSCPAVPPRNGVTRLESSFAAGVDQKTQTHTPQTLTETSKDSQPIWHDRCLNLFGIGRQTPPGHDEDYDMPTAQHPSRRFSRSLLGRISTWGTAIVAAILIGQSASATPIYDSIGGSTSTGSANADINNWLANQFKTDGSTYTVNSVVLNLSALTGGGTISVDIRSDVSGTPGSSLGTLTNPGSFVVGSNTFTASALIPTLAASSSFWVVLYSGGSGSVNWLQTGSTPAGVGSSTDTNRSTNGGLSWLGVVPGTPYMMTVNATSTTVVPEIDPASFGSALSLVLGSLTLLERRRRQG